MTRIDYHIALELKNSDTPFYALIMAAMMRADSENIEILKAGWPAVWRETQARWKAPGGALTGEWPEPPSPSPELVEKLGRFPCVVGPIIPEDVPARGKADTQKRFPVSVEYQWEKVIGWIYPLEGFEDAIGGQFSNILAPAFEVLDAEMKEGVRVIKKARILGFGIFPVWNHVDAKGPKRAGESGEGLDLDSSCGAEDAPDDYPKGGTTAPD